MHIESKCTRTLTQPHPPPQPRRRPSRSINIESKCTRTLPQTPPHPPTPQNNLVKTGQTPSVYPSCCIFDTFFIEIEAEPCFSTLAHMSSEGVGSTLQKADYTHLNCSKGTDSVYCVYCCFEHLILSHSWLDNKNSSADSVYAIYATCADRAGTGRCRCAHLQIWGRWSLCWERTRSRSLGRSES